MKNYFKYLNLLVICLSICMLSCSTLCEDEVSNISVVRMYSPTVELSYGQDHNNLLDYYLEGFVTCDSVLSDYISCISTKTENYMLVHYKDACSSVLSVLDSLTTMNQMRSYLHATDSILLSSNDSLTQHLYCTIKSKFESYANDSTVLVSSLRDSVVVLRYELMSSLKDCDYKDYQKYDIVTQVMVASTEYWTDEDNMEAWDQVSKKVQGKNDKDDKDNGKSDGEDKDQDKQKDKEDMKKLKDGLKKATVFILTDAWGALDGFIATCGTPQGAIAVGSIESALVALSW